MTVALLSLVVAASGVSFAIASLYTTRRQMQVLRQLRTIHSYLREHRSQHAEIDRKFHAHERDHEWEVNRRS